DDQQVVRPAGGDRDLGLEVATGPPERLADRVAPGRLGERVGVVAAVAGVDGVDAGRGGQQAAAHLGGHDLGAAVAADDAGRPAGAHAGVGRAVVVLDPDAGVDALDAVDEQHAGRRR